MYIREESRIKKKKKKSLYFSDFGSWTDVPSTRLLHYHSLSLSKTWMKQHFVSVIPLATAHQAPVKVRWRTRTGKTEPLLINNLGLSSNGKSLAVTWTTKFSRNQYATICNMVLALYTTL